MSSKAGVQGWIFRARNHENNPQFQEVTLYFWRESGTLFENLT